MICQDCGVEAATKHVAFYQNIGALIMRFPKSIEGQLCKSCIHKHFWPMTGTTLILGWWGTISLIVTPFFLLNNVGRYLICLGMPAVPPGALKPVLMEADVEKINPHASDLIQLLNDGMNPKTASELIAHKAGVSPGQVMLYIQALIQQQSQE